MALFYIDAIFADVLQFLRPKFKKAQSYQQSCELLEKRLKELAENVKDVLPNSNVSIKNVLTPSTNSSNMQPPINDGQLEPIKEDSENEIDENGGDKKKNDEKNLLKKDSNNNDGNNNVNCNPLNNDGDINSDNNSGSKGCVDGDYDNSDEEEIEDRSIGNIYNDGDGSPRPIMQKPVEQKDDYDDDDNNADMINTDPDDSDGDLDSNEDIDDEEEDDEDDDDGDDSDENQNNKSNDGRGGGLRIHPCEEDDLFQRDFERLMMENLTSRSQEVTQRMNVEIVIPIERDSDTNKARQLGSGYESSLFSLEPSTMSNNNKNQQSQETETKSFNFRVMTKNQKSNKPILRSIEVPADSDLVQNFLAREQAQKREKEQVKKLILGFNERREMEDQSPNTSNSSVGSIGNNVRSITDYQHNRSTGGGYYHHQHHYRGGGGGGVNYRRRFQ